MAKKKKVDKSKSVFAFAEKHAEITNNGRRRYNEACSDNRRYTSVRKRV